MVPGMCLLFAKDQETALGWFFSTYWAWTGRGNGEVKHWKNTAYLCEHSIGTKRVFQMDTAALDKDNTSFLWHLTQCNSSSIGLWGFDHTLLKEISAS
ncbi:hypothetical protein N7537_005121 [Penicillium hordei]|uniref:Uncharacterized protein n=1 Tax=Penicillium hordei TaxID=40994 RepID=A0AAD6H7S0_9EURO|nr:uncharacterized protein N7537_005121 [Penicillium hordei]KAJ5608502.1 hypothetical protein N7537_005121 [Penicillium hordei]